MFLTDILQSHITGKRTQLKTKFAVTLHGSVRSKVLSDLAADMGIGATYKDILYLYDSWALKDLNENSVCPAELAEEKPGTAIMDNDDWQTEDITGETASVNRTNMMFVQPEKWEKHDNAEMSSEIKRKEVKKELDGITISQNEIKNYYRKDRGEPSAYQNIDFCPGTTTSIRSRLMAQTLTRITECNGVGDVNPDEQDIPSFTGFMNSIMPQDDKSNAYYFLSLPKSPSKAVVYTCLEKAAAAAKEKKMPFIQCIGDQPVYTFIVELKTENPEKFKHILPVLGSFHVQMSFMYAIYKRIQNSNIEDLLSEAGLITSGSVHKALKGKHYYQALRLYKLFYEALTRILIKYGYDIGIRCPESLRHLFDTVKDIDDSRENRYIAFETIISSSEFVEYQQQLRRGFEEETNHMANFIMSIMEMIEILFQNIDSLRRKDWGDFKTSLRLMIPWMLIYDNIHYGRWLPVFYADMCSIPADWEKFMPEIFSQSMTGNPYSALPPDLWIECTMNRGSKLKAGWKYLLKNEKGLLVHIRNINNVNLVRNSLTNLNQQLKVKSCGHKENTKPRRRLDEKALQDLTALIEEWNCNPFGQNQELRTMMSGEVADDKLVTDFESAHSEGEKLAVKIFKERIFSKEKSLYDTMPKQNRLTFATLDKKKNAGSPDTMESKVAINLIDELAKEGPAVFENRITDECLSVFNPNGTKRKCNKAKTKDIMKFEEVNLEDYIVLMDAGHMWRLGTPCTEEYVKSDGSKLTWSDYAERIFNAVLSRHNNAKCFFIVNDYYGSDVIHPKDGERTLRGKKFVGGSTPNVYPASSKELPSVRLLKDFFKTNSNKERFQTYLREEFNKLCKERHVSMIYCTRNISIDISTAPSSQIPIYRNSKIEADNAMFYIYSQIRKSGDSTPVVCDASDVDIILTSSFVSTKIAGFPIKWKKRIFRCDTLLPEEIAKICIRGHVVSGMDNVSSFFGIGKLSIWNRIIKSKEAQDLLMIFTPDSIRKFVIKFVYNDSSSETLAEMRWKRWRRMKKKDFKRIGIDEDTNKERRVLFNVSSIENFEDPAEFGNPLLNGYQLNEERQCVPVRYTTIALPEDIVKSVTVSHMVTDEEKLDGEESDIEDGDEEDEEDLPDVEIGL